MYIYIHEDIFVCIVRHTHLHTYIQSYIHMIHTIYIYTYIYIYIYIVCIYIYIYIYGDVSEQACFAAVVPKTSAPEMQATQACRVYPKWPLGFKVSGFRI